MKEMAIMFSKYQENTKSAFNLSKYVDGLVLDSKILKGRILRFSIYYWLLYHHLLVTMEATVWILLSVMITNGAVVAENSDATGIFNKQ